MGINERGEGEQETERKKEEKWDRERELDSKRERERERVYTRGIERGRRGALERGEENKRDS